MMTTIWPWWTGSVGLSLVTIGFWLMFNRPLGVSGSWARVVMWRNDKMLGEAEAPFRNNPELLKDALMEATVAHFGEQVVQDALASRRSSAAGAQPMPALKELARLPLRIPWTAHFTFLAMIGVGGLLTTLVMGGVHPQVTLGALHTQLFGTGMSNWIALFVGGGLVGFGTQLAGGCTSGHGLSGCSRLVPASLMAMGIAFGAAIIASLLMNLLGGLPL